MIQTQPLEISDFSLGVTDYFLDGQPGAAEAMDNFFLTTNAKPITRWGSIVFQDRLPLGNSRVLKLTQLADVVLAFQDKRVYKPNLTTWAEITGPSGGAIMQAGSSSSVIIDTEWQGHVFITSDAMGSPQKLYVDDVGVYHAVNAGLPAVPAGFSVTNPTGAGSSYLYAAIFVRSYMVGNITYLDRGPVNFFTTPVVGGAITLGNTTTVTLPTTSSPVENNDTANMKIEIYRTIDAGSTYYRVKPVGFASSQVTFGTASVVDNNTDVVLQSNNFKLYTTGGIAENEAPPKAKYVHVVNNFGYWGHIKEGTEVDTTLLRQSKLNDPDSVPGAFNASTEKPITGISSIYDRPIVLTEKYIYRIDNFFADDGTGGMLLRRIDDKAGCISAQSIVQTHVGLFWAGDQGFYWTDGFRVTCVSDHLNLSYKLISSAPAQTTRRKNIAGTFDPANQRVFWTVSKLDGAGETDQVFSIDLKFPFLPGPNRQGATFTTLSGGVDFAPTQFMRLGNFLFRGDPRGYVFRHSIEDFTDPRVDTTIAPSLWETKTIIHLYKSCSLDFGTKFVRKWVPRLLVSAQNATNVSIGISSSNDNNRVNGDLKPILYRGNALWGGTIPVWGDPDAVWKGEKLVEEWRRFPAGGLRCNYKQVIFTNAYARIITSDTLGLAAVSPTLKTATILTGTWFPNLVDYFISFEHDGYVRQFKIVTRTSTVLTYLDPTNVGPVIPGNYKWEIKGYPRGEVLNLNGYVIHYGLISKSHTPFTASSLGSDP